MICRAKFVNQLGQHTDKQVGGRRRHVYLRLYVQDVVNDDTQTLGTADVNADSATHDSMRAFSSLSVLKIRFSARRLTNPGSGNTSSISNE
jgi:hypothetical protein